MTFVGTSDLEKTIPEKTLDLGGICNIVEPLVHDYPSLVLMQGALGAKCIVGAGYPIDGNEAIQRACALGMNLDSYLTAQVANYMRNLGNRKSPVLVWYAHRQGMFFLFFSSKKDVVAGEFEATTESSSRSYVFSDAEPFMYYAGEAGNGDIFRVYYRCEVKEGDYLLYDMGAYGAYRLLSSPERGGYDRVTRNPLGEDDIFYTPVPWESSFVVKWKGRPITVKRALCRLKFGDVVLP